MTIPKSLELGESWPWADSREWLKVRRGQGPLQTLKVAGRTAAVSGCERRAWRSAGADTTAGVCPLPHPLGVPGEAEQPEPELVEVEVGSTALLKCGFSHSQGNFSHIDWFSVHKEKPALIFRVRQGQGQSEPGEYQHRLSLQDKGTTLALTHVTPHDERIFLCRDKRPRSQEHRIQLRVYKAPEEPSIQLNTLGISVSSREPEEVATCVGRNGYPIPQVIWYKNRQPLKEENRIHIQSSQIVESSGLYTLRSVLKAQLLKEDKDAQFYCELNYRLPSGNHMKESREVTVPVFYPAEKVWLEVEPVGILKEGDRVEIRCLADGNPPPHFSVSKQNLSTMLVEEEKTTDDNGILVLEAVQKKHSGLYQCHGLDLETLVSLQSDPQELLVNYVSDVRVSPAAPESQEGSNLTLTCEAESNQVPEFQWLREKTGKVLEKGPVLQLHNLKREAGGSYRCMASVSSVPGLNRTQLVNVTILGPPWMALKERKMWVQENAMLNLSCEASGNPRPTISWNVKGMASEQDQDPQSVLSILNVLVTPELLETGAECMASNSLGKNTTIIFLELDSNRTGLNTSTVNPHARANSTSTEKKLPKPESKGVVIVAVTVCVLVLAVLGALLYFFYKKGKLPCGRSGKQEITLPPSRKSEFVVEVKSDKLPEEMGLLQGSNGDKRAPGDQGEKYIDLRH